MRYKEIILDDKKIKKGIKDGKLIPFSKMFDEMKSNPEEWKEYLRVEKVLEEENEKYLRLDTARKIRKARRDSSITQEELAKRLNTKKSYISLIESGKQNISTEYLFKIAKALNKKVEITIL